MSNDQAPRGCPTPEACSASEALKAARDQIEGLRQQCLRYEGYIDHLRQQITKARAALGVADVEPLMPIARRNGATQAVIVPPAISGVS